MQIMKRSVFGVLVCLVCLIGGSTRAAPQAGGEDTRPVTSASEAQAFERFLTWIDSLSPAQRSEGNVAARYRAYLASRGLPAADVDAEITLLERAHARSEVETWNAMLTAERPRFNVKPNAFLMEMAATRRPGTALDVGMGQGRNSIWLAQQGWEVTGFDPAEQAVARAVDTARTLHLTLKTEIARMEDYDFGERRWDLILLSYVGAREIASVVQRALKPGGIVVVEGFHRDATKTGPIGTAVVFDTGELPRLFPDLRTVRYEEPIAAADFGEISTRLVRYCGERPQ
jgi:SAM-dependent methyltransferase